MENKKWISVKDKLPEANKLVLMASNIKNEEWVVAGEISDVGEWYNQFQSLYAGDSECYPTHWMELPKAPK